MKLLVLYRPDSEHAREVEDFMRDLQRRHGVNPDTIDILNVDSREGAAMASLYDIMMYPSILAVANDGSVLKSWEGAELPLMDEVVSYTFSF